MLKLVVCIIILTAVCSEEHLTCMRTDEVFTQIIQQNHQRALQGSPGKRGPKGQIGSRENPGQKGEPGIPDNHQINLLQDQLLFLSQDVEALKNQSRQNRQIFLMLFSKALCVPPHVYIYQPTPRKQSWRRSREFCQNWGGDLAVFGVQSLENRKKLIQNLLTNDHYWIGANDIASEGNWVWVNGEDASSSQLIWIDGEPNNAAGNQDCVVMRGNPARSDIGLAWDHLSTHSYRGLCEKKI